MRATKETPMPPELRDFAAGVLHERIHKMLEQAEGVQQSEETEPVHQMRVWSRRSRAALTLFEVCFPGKAYGAIERQVKTVTGALGQARDLDVMMETLHTKADRLPENQRVGVLSFVAHLEAERKNAQKGVNRALKQLEQTDVPSRLDRLFAKHHAQQAVTHE